MSRTVEERTSAAPNEPGAPPARELWPDSARIAAICMVVVIHSVAGTVQRTAPGSRMWWGAVLLDAAASWAVPVFAMLSGALLLGADRLRGTAAFYRRRFTRVGIPAVVWIAIYFAWSTWHLHHPFQLAAAAKATLGGSPYFHLYFLFVILGLYAITPFLRVVVGGIGRAELIGLTAGCLAVTWLNGYVGFYGIANQTNALTFFLPYVGYFLAGYALRDLVFRGWVFGLLCLGVVATIVGEAVEVYALGTFSPLYKYSALTIVMSLLVFVVLAQLGRFGAARGLSGRIARPLAEASFGVYLLHPIVMALFLERTGIDVFPATVTELPATVAFTIVATWIVILVVRQVPVLRRIV
ncbi:MAG: acyltransferase family protein [Pseudonocardiales bacterium]